MNIVVQKKVDVAFGTELGKWYHKKNRKHHQYISPFGDQFRLFLFLFYFFLDKILQGLTKKLES